MEFLYLVLDTLSAISGLLVVIGIGALLTRMNILTNEALNALGRLLVYLLVPALLFVCMIRIPALSATLKTNWIFTVAVAAIATLSFGVAWCAVRIFKVHGGAYASVMCTTGLPNGGYMPMALNGMICLVFAQFAGRDGDGIAMVSMGMLALIPAIWVVGYSLIHETRFELKNWRAIITPPIWGILAGIVCGLIFEATGAHGYFLERGTTLHPLYRGVVMISECTIPCALLLLGGKLAVKRPHSAVQKRAVWITAVARLVAVPTITLLFTLLFWDLGWLPHDPLIPLMIVLISAMPPSNDLVIIASSSHKSEGLVASLTFWCYLISILTIPVFISLAIRLFRV